MEFPFRALHCGIWPQHTKPANMHCFLTYLNQGQAGIQWEDYQLCTSLFASPASHTHTLSHRKMSIQWVPVPGSPWFHLNGSIFISLSVIIHGLPERYSTSTGQAHASFTLNKLFCLYLVVLGNSCSGEM